MPAMPEPGDWSYEPPGSAFFGDVDAVRFYLQDTDPAIRLMSDAELQWLIDEWVPKHDSFIFVAAIAAEAVAAKFAGVVSVTADGVSVNVESLAERYRALAVSLRQRHKEHQVATDLDLANLMWGQAPDFSIDPLEFGVSMHDNPEAGRQDYGSHRAWPFPEDTVRPGY